GYDPFLDRDVAIKIVPIPSDAGDLGRRAQLEARELCKLQRSRVHVIDAGATSEGTVYIVMELLPENLQWLINEVTEGPASRGESCAGTHSISPASAIRSSQARHSLEPAAPS